MIERLTPDLQVRDVDAALGHYCEVLGFQETGRLPEDRNQPAIWAQVSLGNAHFMFESEGEPPAQPAGGITFYLRVADVDAVHARLVARGATIVHPPTDQEYGMRETLVTDPDGYRLVFTSPIGEK